MEQIPWESQPPWCGHDSPTDEQSGCHQLAIGNVANPRDCEGCDYCAEERDG